MLKIPGVLGRFSGLGLQTPMIFQSAAVKRALNVLVCLFVCKLNCSFCQIKGGAL